MPKPPRRSADRAPLLAVLALLSCLSAATAQMAVEFRLGGVDVGQSSESLAVKRYGQGLRVEQPDGGTTHIYEDPKAKVSLFVQCGAEGLVDEMQLMEGLARPYTTSLRPRLSLAGLRTGAGLTLGASRDTVVSMYGSPQDERTMNGITWLTWRTDFARDRRVHLSYQLSCGFRGSRLVRILLHNG